MIAALAVAAAAFVAVTAAPADAAPYSCPYGYVKISSNMTSGTWRTHYWVAGGYLYWQNFAGTGLKYSFTDLSYVSNYYYAADGTVTSFYAGCYGT
jgi:hypothetical protein